MRLWNWNSEIAAALKDRDWVSSGAVRDISQALAACGVNVDELESECESAPMSGGMLFKARARLRVPAEVSIDALREGLEEIANDLMVDLSLDDVTQ